MVGYIYKAERNEKTIQDFEKMPKESRKRRRKAIYKAVKED